MKKLFKFILLLLMIYVIYIMVDSIRIGTNQDEPTRPLITLDEEYNGSTLTYKGLGYDVIYNIDSDYSEDITSSSNITGAEFRLFNLVPIYKWSQEVK